MPPKSHRIDVEMTDAEPIMNNEPPPSTLAAQLADNLSTRKPQPLKQNGPEDYKRLLAEVQSFSNIPDEETDIETKIEQNHKTIFVFVRLVLEPLTNDGSSSITMQSLSTACQAIQVLKKSVEETPGVLLHVAEPGSSSDTGGEVFWSWLFPRLLTLIGRDYNAASNLNGERSMSSEDKVHNLLQNEIQTLLILAFRMSSSFNIVEGDLGMKLFSYLKNCTNDVMARISDPSLIANGPLLNPILCLPTSQPTDDLKLYQEDLVSEFAMSTYTIENAQVAYTHALGLLLILTGMLSGLTMPYEAGLDYTAWALDTIVSLHSIRQKWNFESLPSDSKSNLCLLSLGTIRAIKPIFPDFTPTTISCKFHMVLAKLCAECLEDPAALSDEFISGTLCLSLLELSSVCKKFEPVSVAVISNLLPVLLRVSTGDDSYLAKHKDFKLCIRSLQEQCAQLVAAKLEPSEMVFDDVQLNQAFRFLGLECNKTSQSDIQSDGPRPSKRQKTAISLEPNSCRSNTTIEIISSIYCLFGIQGGNNLDHLKKFAQELFTKLDGSDQCRVLELLGLVSCSSSGTLRIVRNKDGGIQDAKCSICDPRDLANQDPHHVSSTALDIYQSTIEILANFVRSPLLAETKRQRILAMLALRKLATHFRGSQFLNIESSSLGQWCVQCLQSSVRELRIAAGRTLSVFLRDYIDLQVLQKNRTHIIQVLRTLSSDSPTHLHETHILAWGQVGRVSNDRELNLVLLRLIEYLGHVNPFVSGVAFNEISALSARARISPQQLFSPFWRNIAVTAVKDLLTRPQTAQLMADLLSISVPELLRMTQSYTLPWLVLSKKKEIVQKIAHAAGKNDVWDISIDTKNLAPILAFLLVQATTDEDEFIMGLLKDLSPEKFKKLSLRDLMQTAPIEIAFELLNASGEADEGKKAQTRRAIYFLASQSRSAEFVKPAKQAKKSSHVGIFLEEHVLGIITHFSDTINNVQEWHPTSEKKRCIRGIEETVIIGQSHIVSALPQICALLQSALTQKDLRTTAFSTWDTMVKLLEYDDLKNVLESTFAIILQHWKDFDNASQQCAHDLVGFLLANREDLVRECFDVLPSLASIPLMATYEGELLKLKASSNPGHEFHVLTKRIGHENASVVAQALLELTHFLRRHQSFLQASAISEQPDKIIGELLRGILDSCVKLSDSHPDIARLSAECIGLVGCLDSNRVEVVREHQEMVVVDNFANAEDTTDFVLFTLEEVLVKAFLSATDSKSQNYLSYAMQELLRKCDFPQSCLEHEKPGDHSEINYLYQKWLDLPKPVRTTLTPFLKSKYKMGEMRKIDCQYPIFHPAKKYNLWLKSFVLDLLQKPQNANAKLIFECFPRIVKLQDTSPATFLLPYVVLHIVVAGTEEHREEIFQELYRILECEPLAETHHERENIKLCSEAVFRVLDYLSRWMQEKKTLISQLVTISGHSDTISSAEEDVMRVERLLVRFPAEIVSQRAVLCNSYARALFHWETHIRDKRDYAIDKAVSNVNVELSPLLERLQQIYTQIDEPDGIEGIAAHLHVLDIDQQILGHRKAGRWTAAQTWYEIKLNEDPHNVDLQLDLLTCLKESGQHDVLLKYVEGLHEPSGAVQKLVPYAAEASWVTGKWDVLNKYLSISPLDVDGDFNMNIGHLLGALHRHDLESFTSTISSLRESIARRLSGPTTDSFRACHDSMLRLHVLTDLEIIAGTTEETGRVEVLESLKRRLEVIGAHPNDKQYLLGIRRAAMQLVNPRFTNLDVASAWLTTAKLAREGNSVNEAFNAVLHALQLGDESATIEQAELLWKEGHSRQAIQILQGAIATNKFISHNRDPVDESMVSNSLRQQQQNLPTAEAHLLLAKWLDSAGQTQAKALRSQYQLAAKTHQSWEEGHYYLGRHYNKLLESQKNLAPEQQDTAYLSGEIAKLVIDNYFRSLIHGTKYIYQTLPRILTLWLDLGTQILEPFNKKHGNGPEFIKKVNEGRKEQLLQAHNRIAKSIQKMPSYIFYTALPQIVARIAHPNPDVVKYLQDIIVKVVSAHPQQALWCLLAVGTSNQEDRKNRGLACLQAIRKKNRKMETGVIDLNDFVMRGERLADQLLTVCNAGDFPPNRTSTCSITRDLKFAPKTCTPNPLAVPIESTLTATLPTLTDSIKGHQAFSRDVITILSFADDVLVLSSLAKPRKLTARGSDGRNYGLLCKPKDDLRKDQRLMEFNSMINRSLKRDAESSKRQLYIKTYAVTPINEECGIIEWVDGLKTFRDILLGQYKTRGIFPHYGDLKLQLDEAVKDDSKLPFFTENVLKQFPPVFHSWFVQLFPEPSAWFVARLKYTRSAAVMSMVGTILGLGDRHTENILFEEGNGGTFHVDFNCLFDKGLTFQQPERVPFRLTHNMVDAMGVYGYEGPFRKSSELTLKLLRQHEETLMTILEAFVHDPTIDLIKQSKKKKESKSAAPDTPQDVLVSIKGKVSGLLKGESVPLSVEGQVDELIKQAVNPKNLVAMYIGWCAFF